MQGSEKADAIGLSSLEPPSPTASSQARKSLPSNAARLTKPPDATGQLYWLYLGAFIILHLLVPLAFVPWLFSWTGVALVFVGNYVFGSLGINLAYHRMLTHRGL